LLHFQDPGLVRTIANLLPQLSPQLVLQVPPSGRRFVAGVQDVDLAGEVCQAPISVLLWIRRGCERGDPATWRAAPRGHRQRLKDLQNAVSALAAPRTLVGAVLDNEVLRDLLERLEG